MTVTMRCNFLLPVRFSSGLTMNLQYTYAKSEGTTAGSNEARTAAQINNFEADRGQK